MVVVHELVLDPVEQYVVTVYPSFRAQDKTMHQQKKECFLEPYFFARKINQTLQEPWKTVRVFYLFFFLGGGRGTLQKNQINTKIGSNKPQIKHIKRGGIILLNPSKNLQGWPSGLTIQLRRRAPELPRSDRKLSCIHHHIVLQQYLPPNSKAGRVTWNPPPGRRKNVVV